jgi:hypothetical protein
VSAVSSSADDVRRAALRVQGLGDDVRLLADRAQACGVVGWRSGSAEEFRQRLDDQVARMRLAAVRLDEAAAALRRHAVMLDLPTYSGERP